MKPVKKIVDKKAISALKQFTDREEPRESFYRAFAYGKQNPDEFNVMSYYGIGGFGKSRLLHELMNYLKEKNEKEIYGPKTVFTLYDFEEGTDRLTCLSHMKNKLKKQGLEFPLFEAAEIAFNEKSGIPMYQNLKEETLLENPILSVTADFIPGAKGVLELIKTGKDVLESARGYFQKLKKLWDVDEKEMTKEIGYISSLEAKEIEEQLSYYFAKDLLRNTEHASDLGISLPIVLFLDTYEILVNSYKNHEYSGVYDEWLRNDIIKTVPGMLYVIGGREKLNWEEKDPFFEGMEEHELGDLSKKDAFSFLRNAGVSENLLEDIYRISGGTPLFLDLSVNTYYEKMAESGACTKEDFGIDKEALIERFFRYMEPEDRKIAIVLAVLRKWTDEEYSKIGPEIMQAQFDYERYRAFNEHTIILKDEKTRYYMHESVREVLNKVSFQSSYLPLRQKTVQAYAAYLASCLKDANRALTEISADITDLSYLLKNEVLTQEHIHTLWVASSAVIEKLMDKGFSNLLLDVLSAFANAAGKENLPVYCASLEDKIMILSRIGREDLGLDYAREVASLSKDHPELKDAYYRSQFFQIGILKELNEFDEVDRLINDLDQLIANDDYKNRFQLTSYKADISYQKGDAEECIRLSNECLDLIAKGNLGESALGETYLQLGVALFHTGNVQSSNDYIHRGYDILRNFWGETHHNTLQYLNQIVGISIFQGDIKTAVELVESAEEEARKQYGEYSANYRMILILKACCYAADSLSIDALKILEYVGELQKNLPHVDYRMENMRLEQSYLAAADLNDTGLMLAILQEQEKFIKKNFGEDALQLISHYQNFQEYFFEMDDYDSMIRYGEMADAIQTKHPYQLDTLNVHYWTGKAYLMKKEYENALPYLKEAYENYNDAAIQEPKRKVVNDYLEVLISLKKYDTYISVYENGLDDDAQITVKNRIDYAFSLMSTKRYEESAEVFGYLVEIYDKDGRAKGKGYYETVWDQAHCYYRLKQTENYIKTIQKIDIDAAKKFFKPERVMLIVNDLAQYYDSQKQYTEALYYSEILREYYVQFEYTGKLPKLDRYIQELKEFLS